MKVELTKAKATQMGKVAMELWLCSKKGVYHLEKEELKVLEDFCLMMRGQDPETAQYNEEQIAEFCCFLHGYLQELNQAHPGLVWTTWKIYLAKHT